MPVFAAGPCVVCDKFCTFNPDNVPSFNNRPICQDCIELINAERVKLGEAPIIVYPDSYEPAEY